MGRIGACKTLPDCLSRRTEREKDQERMFSKSDVIWKCVEYTMGCRIIGTVGSLIVGMVTGKGRNMDQMII